MPNETTRRAVLSAVLGAGIGGMALTDARSYLERFAPGSGSVWGAANRNAPEELSSPYGPATVRYDDYHVPHVDADGERAAYYAVGYCHGADRFFQMDLYQRLMAGRLSAVVGESTVDSDAFHRQMDFEGAAAATWERAEGTETGDVVEAYVEGVNHAVATESTPLEYRLLDFEPAAWTPTAAMLIAKQISWGLTGSFLTLRRALARDRLGAEAAETLYPRIMDHETPIVGGGDAAASLSGDDAGTPDAGLVSWLDGFGSDPGIGSNSWVVSGEHTASGDPIVVNDPHLNLTVPPVWYEQHVDGPGDLDVRGVSFPGVPFVIIGQNHAGAWGFTNAGADVIDFYTYETTGDGGYRYGDDTRQFDLRTETIEVADGENVDVDVKRSVHGAVLTQYPDGDEFETADELGVAWTGLSATRTVDAVRELNWAGGVDEAEAAIRKFDEPTQNFVYADESGSTYYWVTGQIPIRTTDGEPVRGTRIFDGSAREGEWGDGYTPYGESSWAGFVPYEEKPGVRNPDSLATANQRITNDPEHYLSEGYAPPFRGKRIDDRLDARAGSDEPMDAAFNRDVQLDVVDGRYDLFRPIIAEAVEAGVGGDDLDAPTAESLLEWDGEMRPDAAEPLLFDQWLRTFRDLTFIDEFSDAELPVGFAEPNFWVLGTLPADSEWFDGDRAAVAAEALGTVRARIDDEGWETYGDWNRVRFTHPFDQPFLNYDQQATAGSAGTVRNFRAESSRGSSWRMVATFDGDSRAILPGGNAGDYFSAHYDDQLSMWADGEYKPMDRAHPKGVDIAFEEGEQ